MKRLKRALVLLLSMSMLAASVTGCSTDNSIVTRIVVHKVEDTLEDLLDKLKQLLKIPGSAAEESEEQTDGTYAGDALGGSAYVGDWLAVSCEYMGFSVAVSDVLGGDVLISLYEDGTAVVTMDGESQSGSWEETEDGLLLGGYADIQVESAGEGQMVVEYEGISITFEKQ